jgi:hypothetical protein
MKTKRLFAWGGLLLGAAGVVTASTSTVGYISMAVGSLGVALGALTLLRSTGKEGRDPDS